MPSEQDVVDYLNQLSKTATDGQRLPPVRHLMGQFSLSQLVVQRALASLKESGLIQAEVGRGTFFRLPGSRPRSGGDPVPRAEGPARSVIFLRRSVSARYGRTVLHHLEDMLTGSGRKVLEVSYNDAQHARSALRGLPAFDACVLQSSFETVSIETLQAIRQKCSSIVLHGLGLTGTEVDCVGHDWGSSIAKALRLLRESGHRRIGFATSDLHSMSNLMGIRRFMDWCEERRQPLDETLISLPLSVREGGEEAIADALARKRSEAGSLPFTAVICWGVQRHDAFLAALAGRGLRVPDDLSVVLLGGPDDAGDQRSRFTTLGATSRAQAEGIHRAVERRIADPGTPPQVTFLPVERYDGHSVGEPPRRG